MANLLSLLSEYRMEYAKALYRKPKIYHGGPDYDLKKRWYVYYSYLNPATGKMERQPPLYNNINRDFHTVNDRIRELKLLRDAVEELLRDGFSPYAGSASGPQYTAESALDYAFELKSQSLSDKSTIDYSSRLNTFKDYLAGKSLINAPVTAITRKVVKEFLAEMMLSSGVKNRNNTRAVLSSLFSILEDQEIIPSNFITSIPKLKHTPVKHRKYTDSAASELFKWLDKNDPVLSLFIKFVSYNFLRPVEACRIRVRDLDLKSALVTFQAKNKPVKYKRIPEVLLTELASLDLSNPDHFLFTPSGPGYWDASEISRRDHFTKRYKEAKDHFNLRPEYSIYSYRHTFITRLYQNLRKTYRQTETFDIMMGITGHTSLSGLMNYLRDIDAEIPEDWSGLLG